jgi:hypothetical protein
MLFPVANGKNDMERREDGRTERAEQEFTENKRVVIGGRLRIPPIT